MNVLLVSCEIAESVAEAEDDALIVVCSTDGVKAAETAGRIENHRTAVFVCELDDEGDRQLAEVFCEENFGVFGPVLVKTSI